METRGKKRQREEDSTSSTSTSTPRSFSAGETSAGVSAASRQEKSKGVTREKKPRIDKMREKSRLDKSRKASKKPESARKSQPAPLQSQQQSQALQQQQQQQQHQQQQQQQQRGGTGPSDPEKRKQIQQQLVLLLHAHKCQRREQDMQVSGEYTPCSLPHCKTMKNVLNHMALCQEGRNCPYPHCASSRQIITHWRNCNRSDCQVCLPLKHASSMPRRGAGGGASAGQGPTGEQSGWQLCNFPQNQVMNPMQDGVAGRPMMPSRGQPSRSTLAIPIPNISSVPTKPWHNEVAPGLRQQLVRKLVDAIYPVHDPIALQDRRVYSLIQYAMKVEKTMFESASSKKNYFELLAHKIYSLKKELDDRKKRAATSVHSSTFQSNEAELKSDDINKTMESESSIQEDQIQSINNLEESARSKQQKEIKLYKEVTTLIKRKTTIERKVANFMLAGLPGNGKTTFLDRLLGRPIQNFYASTGLADDIAVVDAGAIVDIDAITADYHSAFVADESNWMLLENLDVSFNLKEFLELDESEELSCIEMEKNTVENFLQTSASSLEQHDPTLSQHVKEVLQSLEINSMLDLKVKNTYYFRDIGGQMEFQECISLFIYGPSIFIFVFNANIDIEKKQIVRYRMGEDKIINEYQSSISTKDALLQCLASISSMENTAEQHSTKSITPLVLIVGTHIDLLGPDADIKVKEIDENIDTLICSHHFQEFVQYADKKSNKVIFPVNNTSENMDDIMKVRRQIDRILLRSEFTIDYPISYLMVCLELHRMNNTVLTLSKFQEIAAKYEIEEDSVTNLLRFLHFKVGIIQYFEVDGLKELVVVKPQVLFKKVTDLVEKTFLSSSSTLKSSEEDEFLKKGILKAEAFESILSENDHMSSKEFIKFLLHLRMMVSFVDHNGVMKYFIPAVLNHAPKSHTEEESRISTLSITFDRTHCPKGLFAMLVTHLMSPANNFGNEMTFKLLDKQIYQDQVAFKFHLNDKVIIKMCLSHLEVKLFPNMGNYDYSPVMSVSQRCTLLRKIIEKCINSSLTYLHYSVEKLKPMPSLRCKTDKCDELHKVGRHIMEGKYFLECGYSCYYLPESAQYWYSEDLEINPCIPAQHPSKEQAHDQQYQSVQSQQSGTVTLSALLQHVSISEQSLYTSCTDSHLYSIAEKIHPSEWTSFASLLGLSSNVLGDLREDVERAREQRYQGLQCWKRAQSFRATYHVLVDKCLGSRNAELAEFICELVKSCLGNVAQLS